METLPTGNTYLPLAAAAAEPAVRPASEAAVDPAKAKDAAEKFEGLFVADLLRQMRRSTRELAADDSIYKDRINDDMLDFADTLMADALAGQRAFGIADVILRQLLPPTPTPAAAAAAGNLSMPAKRSPSSKDS